MNIKFYLVKHKSLFYAKFTKFCVLRYDSKYIYNMEKLRIDDSTILRRGAYCLFTLDFEQ